MTIDDATLKLWRAICDAATPGPWKWWTSNSFRRLSATGDGDVLHGSVDRRDGVVDIVGKDADKEFIESARSILPVLLDEVERLRTIAADWETMRFTRNAALDQLERMRAGQPAPLLRMMEARDAACRAASFFRSCALSGESVETDAAMNMLQALCAAGDVKP